MSIEKKDSCAKNQKLSISQKTEENCFILVRCSSPEKIVLADCNLFKMMMEVENSIWTDNLYSSNFLSVSSSSATATMNEHRSQSSSYYDPFRYNFWTPSRQDKDLLFPIEKKLTLSPIPTSKPQTFNLNYSYHQNTNNININNNTTTTSSSNNNNVKNNNQMSRLRSNEDVSSMIDFNGYFSNRSPARLNHVRTNTASTSPGYLCVFCKSNSEPEEICRSHPLRLSNNIVVCPSLRNYTCCICKATGDNAHTIKYCPYNKRGYYATRSHEKCNTNNNSKFRMKVHVVDGILDAQQHHQGVANNMTSCSVSQQQEKDNTFHQRHFRPIPMTPSSESDDDETFNLEPQPVKTTKGSSRFQHNRSINNNGNPLNHQLVFFNRTIQKSRC